MWIIGLSNIKIDFLFQKSIFLPHLFSAAFCAISLRLSADNVAARATPPFKPPNRPNATAASFFAGFSLSSFVACSVMNFANRFKSFFAILQSYA